MTRSDRASDASSAMTYFPSDQKKVMKKFGKKALLASLEKMLLIRNFEACGVAAYQKKLIGGFYHTYAGQEALQTAVIDVLGVNNWYVTSYRCHALALLLGATPNELMAELYGKANGNAKGRGGSMHFYTERLLGGFGIVGGQIPIATGAALSVKYLKREGEVAVCFMGDGAVAQGAFHESLNIAALWNLPCIYIIENNVWGMGTNVSRAVSVKGIAEKKAVGYGIKSYNLDGMDYFNCAAGMEQIYQEVVETSRPVLVEVFTARFDGHSVSDPALYRSKEELTHYKARDPINLLSNAMIEAEMLSEEEFKAMGKQQRQIALAAMEHAEQSPLPNPATLEEEVFAP